MDKDKALKLAKVSVLILFLISLFFLYQYEYKVKGYYENNPESFQSDKEKVLSYLNTKRCISEGTLHEQTNFSYFQARYLLHELSKDKLVLKYPGQGICLSYQAKVQLALQKNQ